MSRDQKPQPVPRSSHMADLDTLRAENARLRKALTHCLGIIVEFGDLNGFRNMTDEELGRSVWTVAKEAADALSAHP